MVGGESYVESNEEEGPGLDDQSERVIDIVDAFHLRQTAFNKKQYSLEIRAYMQRLRKWLTENNPERVEAFMAGAQGFVKHVV